MHTYILFQCLSNAMIKEELQEQKPKITQETLYCAMSKALSCTNKDPENTPAQTRLAERGSSNSKYIGRYSI